MEFILKKEIDIERTKRLAELGFKVIRFKNEEVENEIEKVLVKIKKEIKTLNSHDLS